jgi:hypothetical protein
LGVREGGGDETFHFLWEGGGIKYFPMRFGETQILW